MIDTMDISPNMDESLMSDHKKKHGVSRTVKIAGIVIGAISIAAIVVLLVVLNVPSSGSDDSNDDGTTPTPTTTQSLGNALYNSYTIYNSLPVNTSDAVAQGWHALSPNCEENLGFLYSQAIDGPTEQHPLALWFTEYGQITGAQATIWGSNAEVGDAAQPNLVEKGYWRTSDYNSSAWSMDVSFRPGSDTCSKTKLSETIGTQLVINQDSIAHNVPIYRSVATEEDWTCGSCMRTMGQHHFYDLSEAPQMSWNDSQLLPIVPMYWPTSSSGWLSAFFFTTPVSQYGDQPSLNGQDGWDPSPLTPDMMCQNFCDDNCTWTTSLWSTMHIFFDRYESIDCLNGTGLIGRSCTYQG